MIRTALETAFSDAVLSPDVEVSAHASIVHLHIDRLIVEGLPVSAKAAFLRALEAELTRLVDNSGDFSSTTSSQTIKRIDAGVLRLGSSPSQAAAQVAVAIRQSLLRGREELSHG